MQTDDVLTVPADAAARAELLERLRLLATVDHPCVEPVGTAATSSDGTLRVPRGAGTATDLPTVLAVRSRCDVPEAAGIAVAVAQGLAALHSAGIVHGPPAAADVVVALDGRPRLRPRLACPEGAVAEADDVHGLALLVDSLVDPADSDATVALRAALAPALAGDPRVRPEAGTLAARVDDAVPPVPVRLPEPAVLAAAVLGRGRGAERTADPGRRSRHRRARRPRTGPVPTTRRRADLRPRPRRAGAVRRAGAWRTGLGVAGVAVVVAALVGVGLHVAGPAGPPAVVTAAEEPAPRGPVGAEPPGAEPQGADAGDVEAEDDDLTLDRTDPAGAAAELTRRRAELLTGERAVEEVSLAGSAAHQADAALVARAQGDGTSVSGAELSVTSARTTSGPADGAAEVVVEYVVGPHEQVGQDGSTVQVPGGERQTAVLTLSWTADGWRVTDVA
ncbi:hypothetical protein MWU57_14920 [Isoptericola sp. S6320L]|uniref:hypothetical protein n=1 Tax=Isoptericola sp. S6320L TaxID=2926411 RepID=UPI001FF4C012|nr:hypothetical protein [Isoptericola sp. S6320L]MCK0118325.1 hypothetical protein [Isoptericola sp. S6320L]